MSHSDDICVFSSWTKTGRNSADLFPSLDRMLSLYYRVLIICPKHLSLRSVKGKMGTCRLTLSSTLATACPARFNIKKSMHFVNSVFLSQMRGDWRKLHNEELHNLYSSPNIIRMIKSRRMRWAGHVARMGATRNAYRLLMGRDH
jgi:hypothetical protein